MNEEKADSTQRSLAEGTDTLIQVQKDRQILK